MRARNNGGRPWATSLTKRAFDFALSGLLFIVSSPVLAVILAWSAISFKANPLIRQSRVGLRGDRFKLLKIRTLPTNVPPNLGREDLDEFIRPGKVARVIRSTHLDELPQFLNVVVGHMSLVGPRPMIQEVIDRLDPGFASVRHAVRPGVTGLWQISTKGSLQLSPVEGLDVEYITNSTPMLDLKIAAATLTQAFRLTSPIEPSELLTDPTQPDEASNKTGVRGHDRVPQNAAVIHD